MPCKSTPKPSTTLEQAALLLLCTRFPFWLSISLANKSYGKLNSHASNLIGIQLQQKKIVFLYPVDGANLISWLLKVPITIQFTNARERFFLAKLSSPYYTAIRNKFVFKTKWNFLYRLDGQICIKIWCCRPRVLKREDKRPTVAMYDHGFPSIKNRQFFCSEQLHRQIKHQNARIFKRNWLILSPPAIYI